MIHRLLGLALLAGCAPGAADAEKEPATEEPSTEESYTEGTSPGPVFGTWLPEDYTPSAPENLIFFGDSVTVGEGATQRTREYNQLLMLNDDEAWPGFAEDDLESTFGEVPPTIYDVAQGGATTGQVVAWQLPNLESQLPDVVEGETLVVATIGGNDMVVAVFASQLSDEPDVVAQAEVDKMVENLSEISVFFADTQRFPDPVYLYIANIYEPTDTVGQAEVCFNDVDVRIGIRAIDLANLGMLELAQEEGFGYVDMRSHFLGHGQNAGDESGEWYVPDDATTWFVDDCIHPNDRGHHEIRRLFSAAIAGEPLQAPVAVK